MATIISKLPDRTVSLETPRLVLRAARPEDAEGLFVAFKDEEVMRYWSSKAHEDLIRTRQWVEMMIDSSQNGITDFVICLKSDVDGSDAKPEVIGKIGIYASLPSNEIGFILSRQHWQRGLGGEALKAILRYLFNLCREPGDVAPKSITSRSGSPAAQFTTLTPNEKQSQWLYPSISADTDPRNAPCIRLLQSVGFKESGYVERTMQVGGEEGEWVDSQFWRLTWDEWKGRSDTDA